MNRAVIIQGNYIPWKGYFDNIAQCDVVVVYDDMQYTKNDWRNRNKIKTAAGVKWLTVPVETKGLFGQPINMVRISGGYWRRKHLAQLGQAYSRASHFKAVHPWVEHVYMEHDHDLLTDLNVHLMKAVCSRLGITTVIRDSREFALKGERTERLISICKELGATEYLTGPAARAYLDEQTFERAGIKVVWADYSNYPAYDQLFPPFTHAVSILDLLYNTGDRAREFMKMAG